MEFPLLQHKSKAQSRKVVVDLGNLTIFLIRTDFLNTSIIATGTGLVITISLSAIMKPQT